MRYAVCGMWYMIHDMLECIYCYMRYMICDLIQEVLFMLKYMSYNVYVYDM